MLGPSIALRSSGAPLRGLAAVASAVILLGFAGCDGDPVGQETQDATSCDGAKIDKGGRCRLPNGRFAKKACCEAPATACHATLAAAIDACIVDQRENGDWDPATSTLWDLTAACADLEPMAGVRDSICESEDASFCSLGLEAFATEVLPICRREAEARALDATCVFGSTWSEALRSEAIVVVGDRRLEDGDALGPLQAEQIVAAVRQSSHEPSTVAEAFAAVDQGEINFVELWDASARRSFSAYEFGAGDNSYGAIFAQGTTTVAASIGDGDLSGCQSFWGPERRRCQEDLDCTAGARCTGASEASPLGRCIDATKDTHPATQADCSRSDLDFGCPAGSGLRCAGGSVADGDTALGMCWPAWMTSSFGVTVEQDIPDGNAGGVEAQLLAYGLATADVEVRIDLLISHPRPADLLVTLVNPADNEVLVFDGATTSVANGEVFLDGVRLGGFSGDEGVNGVWRLRVVDRAAGQRGTLHRFGVTISSRWD